MNISEYIASGVLELYILGAATEDEAKEIEALSLEYPALKEELDKIEQSLGAFTEAYAGTPPENAKVGFKAGMEYVDNLMAGALPAGEAPELGPHSTQDDYAKWLAHPSYQDPESFDNLTFKIISQTENIFCGIVWASGQIAEESHADRYERFLILQGSCTIDIEGDLHKMDEGDYLEIPLHKKHLITVTSEVPCKILLQRVAA